MATGMASTAPNTSSRGWTRPGRWSLPTRRRRARLSLFVVATSSPGLSASRIPVEIQSPEKQFTLFFDNVQVSTNRLIGEEGSGLKQVFTGLVPERITGAALANGLGLSCLDKAARYARERKVWGEVPIGAHQGIAHPLAKAKIEVEHSPDDEQGGLVIR